MTTKQKTRVEFYVPFVSMIEYDVLIYDLVEIFCIFFGGCTINKKLDGYYRADKTIDIIPDVVNIIWTDVPLLYPDDSVELIKFCENVTGFINRQLPNEDYIYFSIIPVDVPD